MQQLYARKPVGVAPIQTAADAHRRDSRHIAAVAEGGADNIELILNTEEAGADRQDIPLALEFAAAKDSVVLGIDRSLRSPAPGPQTAVSPSQVLPVSRRKIKPLKRV